nr:terminase large subunit [uncultured Bacteroides sp.]
MNINNIEEQEYYKYAEDVLAGKITAGRYIKLACSRFFSLLQNEDYYFDIEAVNRVVEFIGLIKHYLGKYAGKPFILQPWQTFIIANIYGFYYKESKKRLCRSVYILMARKQGKSALAAGLSLFHLIADGEQAGEIYFAANSREQAKILLNITTSFARSLDPKLKLLEIYRDTIKFKAANSFIKVVSSDTKKLDGLNVSFCVCDELHEATNSKMIDIFTGSMGMREQPLIMTISTAGFNLDSICKQLYDANIEILENIKQDDSMFSFIYQLDNEDKWDDEKCWSKSNPNLDVTVTSEYLRGEIKKAKNITSLETSVKTKNLNMWCSSSAVWIPEKYIKKATQKIDLEDFKNCDCYIGLDLAATQDLTCLSLMLLKDNKYYFYNKYYLPSSALEGNPNSFKYQLWHKKMN